VQRRRAFVQGVAGLADEVRPSHGGSLVGRCKGTAAADEELVLAAGRGVQRPRSETRPHGHHVCSVSSLRPYPGREECGVDCTYQDGGGYDIFLRTLIEYKLNQTHAHYIHCKARPKQFH
jgi:hypothetical protein